MTLFKALWVALPTRAESRLSILAVASLGLAKETVFIGLKYIRLLLIGLDMSLIENMLSQGRASPRAPALAQWAPLARHATVV